MLLLSGGCGWGGGGRGRDRVRDFRSKNPDLDLYCQPTRLLNTLFSTLFCTEFAVFLQLYTLAHNILIHPLMEYSGRGPPFFDVVFIAFKPQPPSDITAVYLS